MQITIAIDGPAAAGKGTIARAIATRFGFQHLDTGMLYRAVGMQALDHGRGVVDSVVAEEIAKRLRPADLARNDLRTPRASRTASIVATLPAVRDALLAFQRDFARQKGGAVLDGRDIGTVVCPEAELKFFVTATDAVRARRRYEELVSGGADTTLERVAADLASRDSRDSARDVAPLVPADDAVVIDTSEMSVDVAVDHVARAIIEKTGITTKSA